jgi:hypothetical protein
MSAAQHVERRAVRASDCMPVPVEGQRVQVLWARLGTKGEASEQWCDAEFLGRRGDQYLIHGCTPRSPFPTTRPVSPGSIRFTAVQQ